MPATSWTGPAGAEMVPRFRSLAAEFAAANGVPRPPLDDVKLAVSEALTNAVLHAYCERPEPGPVTVALSVEPQRAVEVVVRDEGRGLAPRKHSPGAGLGLSLIRSLADEVAYRRPDDGSGTEIWMRFDLTRRA